MLIHLHHLYGYLRAAREPIKSVSLFSKMQQVYRIFFVFSSIAFVLTHSDLFYYKRSFNTQGASQGHSDSLKRLELTTLPAKRSAVTATLPVLVVLTSVLTGICLRFQIVYQSLGHRYPATGFGLLGFRTSKVYTARRSGVSLDPSLTPDPGSVELPHSSYIAPLAVPISWRAFWGPRSFCLWGSQTLFDGLLASLLVS